ncbi:MAG: hypothetical protein ACYS7Y_25275 [Planctomycetota bacterium]|jgi:hypothetical protein
MSCVKCGGDVHVNGDGDLLCQGSCGDTLTRAELEDSWSDDEPKFLPLPPPPFTERPEKWDEENWEENWEG